MRVPGGRMAERVLHEIDEHLGQQFPVAPDDEAALDPALEALLLILGEGGIELDDRLQQSGEVDRREAGARRAGLDLGDPQHGARRSSGSRRCR